MKPLKLTLRGINSYRKEQVIDFSALTSSGLFGIFGPTGSGKSSILDAITLALYAKLPRSTKNFININEQTAAVSFRFSITTTGTKIYQVERGFRYHKSNTGSTVRNTSASLADITDETPLVLADRPTDVTQECTRILGLNSDDFMRTVVLPQGQFSDFLKLKNAERRGMLQRIFHLEQYGLELTQKITAARQKHDLLLSSLEGQLQIFENITPEALQDIQRRLAIIQEKEKKATEDKQKAEAVFKEAEALHSLLAEYAPVKETYEKLCSQSSSMKEIKRQLELSKQANQLRPFALEVKRTDSAYQEACLLLEKAKKELATSSSACEILQQQKEQIFQEYETKLPIFLEQEQEYRNALERCHSISQWKNNCNTAKKELAQQKKKQDSQSKENILLVAEEADLRKQITEQNDAASRFHIPRERLTGLEKGHVLEETYREKRKHYEENKQNVNELQEKRVREMQELKSLSTQLCALQQSALSFYCQQKEQLNEQKKLLGTMQTEKENLLLSLEQLENQHHALALQVALKEGEICPVCGGIYHAGEEHFPENRTESEEQKENRRIKTRIKKLEKEEARLTTETNQSEQQIALIKATLRNMEHLFATAGFTSTFSTTEKTSSDTFKNVSSSKITANHQTNSTPDTLQHQFQQLSSDYVSSRERLSQLSVQQENLQEQLSRQKAVLQDSADEILELRRQWNTQNFTKDLAQARAAGKEYDLLQEKLDKLRKQLDSNQKKKESLAAMLSESAASISALENEILHLNTLIETEQQKLPIGQSSESDFSLLLKNVQKQRKNLEDQKKTIDAKYQEAATILQSKREQLTAADSRETICKTNQEQAAAVLQKQWEISVLPQNTNLDALYLSQNDISSMESTLKTFEENLSKTKDRLLYLEEKRQGRDLSEEDWGRIKKDHENTIALMEKVQKEKTLLLQEAETVKEQLKQKSKLEKDYQDALHKKGQIRQLETLFKGNAFIEYVAEARLKYVAAEASSILSAISNGNYELEINDSSEFIIRDDKNGGILRPCDTLSGGEIFITSLSLALALSSVIQLNGTAPLELFFLDEGFGSLDDELLDVVMTSLERLQNNKRSIGIITHVEAIQERVPVKLVVTPSDISQNGSTIRMEYS